MKSTKRFKDTIKSHLDNVAANDTLFAETLKKENKNIDDCITYILNQVKASGCAGFADEEIFGMAIHYYDEDDIKVGSPVDTNVVVNHQVELTEEEKQAAKQKALDSLVEEEKKKIAGNKKVKLTADDLKQAQEIAKQQAIDEAIEAKKEKLKRKAVKKQPEAAKELNVQSSLF